MKAKSFPLGWTALVPLNDSYTFSFKNSTQFTNISYNLNAEEMGPNDHLYFKHIFKQTPDHFRTVSGRQAQKENLEALPVPSVNKHGEWYYEQKKSELTYLLSGLLLFLLFFFWSFILYIEISLSGDHYFCPSYKEMSALWRLIL